jgi:hypothetical protein
VVFTVTMLILSVAASRLLMGKSRAIKLS